MARIGFVGLGNMGGPMAANLVRAGHEVAVFDLDAAAMARVTGAPVLFVGLASKPCIRIGSWDRTLIPLPFSRGAMVWDGPAYAGREDDLEALNVEWAARLSAVTRRAEALLDATGCE